MTYHFNPRLDVLNVYLCGKVSDTIKRGIGGKTTFNTSSKRRRSSNRENVVCYLLSYGP